MASHKDRPIICPCPKTCDPIYNALAFDDRIKSGDLNEGYSGECVGKMIKNIIFIVNGHKHDNDLNRCVFTPMKGIIRFQENAGDLESSIHVMFSALDEIAPIKCVDCGTSGRLFIRYTLIEDQWHCKMCAVRLGLLTFDGKRYLRVYSQGEK